MPVLAGCAGDLPGRGGAPAAQPATVAPRETAVSGARFALPDIGIVFLRQADAAPARQLDLVIHFHGAADVVEREAAAAGLQAAFVVVNYPGLSKAYERPFSDPALFERLLMETLGELQRRGLAAPDAGWRRVALSSFSAGFGAVRAILRQPEHDARIDALYLADTLYAGYAAGRDGVRRPDPEHMAPFRRFAAEAAAGRKIMLITHSYLAPGSYAGTHKTADDLIEHVGAARTATDEAGPGGLQVVSRTSLGRFEVRGCAGTTGADHMAHLRNLRYGYARLRQLWDGDPRPSGSW
ncbi:MAG: hypothetical protein AB1716_03430 [Planctomycetota bacterium]